MTKSQLEEIISEAIVRFEKEYMGREPDGVATKIIKDMIFVRLSGVLTPAEEQLAKTTEGADLIKKTRVRLLEGARVLLDSIIADISGSKIKSLHSDISTKTGERVIIFVLDKNTELLFKE